MSTRIPEQTPQSVTDAGAPAGRSGPDVQPPRPFGFRDLLFAPGRLLLRLFFPRLYDRYVLGELLGPLLFGWTLFLILYVFAVHLFRLAQAAARGATPAMVGEMLWLQTLLSSVTCLPMAMLLAALLAFGRLSGDSELVAAQAGGISNGRAIFIAFLMGLLLSGVGLALNEYVLPPAGARLQNLQEMVKLQLKGKIAEALQDRDKSTIIQDFEGGRLSRLVAARKFEPENPPYPALLRDITYIQYSGGHVSTIIEAQRAEYVGTVPGRPGQREWRFIDGSQQFMAHVTGKYGLVIPFDTEIFVLNKSPEQVSRDQKEANQMSYRELKTYIRELKASRVRARAVRELDVELERKLSVPFASLVLALIGAPLGIRRQRQTAGVGIGMSLLIIIFYYIGMSVFGVLGESGDLGPVEAAWACNVIALGAGLYLTWRATR